MKELSEELQELKENPRFVNESVSSSRVYQGKLDKFKAELQSYKEQFDNQEIVHKEKVKQLLDTHKEQLKNYLNIINTQKGELNKSNNLINGYKKEAMMIKVCSYD